MVRESMTWRVEELLTSTSGAETCTVMDSDCAATCIGMSIVKVWLRNTSIPSSSLVVKPGLDAEMEYMPAGSASAR